MKMRETQRKGDIAVAQAVATFTKMGYEVALPLTESAAYDLLVDAEQNIYKVQVRFTSNGEVDLRRIHSNSKGYVVKKTKKNAYDWLYILIADGREYLIKKCLDSRRSVKPLEEYRILPASLFNENMAVEPQEKRLVKTDEASGIM